MRLDAARMTKTLCCRYALVAIHQDATSASYLGIKGRRLAHPRSAFYVFIFYRETREATSPPSKRHNAFYRVKLALIESLSADGPEPSRGSDALD
jgi:hypothetical protein